MSVLCFIVATVLLPSAALAFVHFAEGPALELHLHARGARSCSTSTSLLPITQATSASNCLHAEKAATLGMGCFWKPSESMLSVPGVTSTMAGYTGKPNASAPPTYSEVCASRDWVEAVRVTYDDETITYPQLLDAFFDAQEANPASRQYASIIFPTEEQAPMAEAWLDDAKAEKRVNSKGLPALATTIESSTKFYRAENYHQEFWQKNRPRFAVGLVLLAVASGVLSGLGIIADEGIANKIETAANGAFLAGAIAMQAERWLDKEVFEVK